MTEQDGKDPFADVKDEDETEKNEACINLDEDNSEGSGSNASSDEQYTNWTMYAYAWHIYQMYHQPLLHADSCYR